MRKIPTNNYNIYFEKKGFSKLDKFIKKQKYSKIFVLVDENTHENCLHLFASRLPNLPEFEILEIESGEENKNIETCIQLWEALTELGGNRNSLLVNLGGGVITDMGGFVASSFKRGIDFINIPTTLLAMVDASVGGKTGIDLGELKNQIGFFNNPKMIVIEPLFLKTLSDEEFKSGTAEVIKYGITLNDKMYDNSINMDINSQYLSKIIRKSAKIKVKITDNDFKETGKRKILNFGHTIGHSIESEHLRNPNKTKLLHGEAIAIGMICESFLAHKILGISMEIVDGIKHDILTTFDKVELLESDFEIFLDLMKHDKKNIDDNINFSLMNGIGKFKINCFCDTQTILESLKYYNK